jgi:hypothetical protein
MYWQLRNYRGLRVDQQEYGYLVIKRFDCRKFNEDKSRRDKIKSSAVFRPFNQLLICYMSIIHN